MMPMNAVAIAAGNIHSIEQVAELGVMIILLLMMLLLLMMMMMIAMMMILII